MASLSTTSSFLITYLACLLHKISYRIISSRPRCCVFQRSFTLKKCIYIHMVQFAKLLAEVSLHNTLSLSHLFHSIVSSKADISFNTSFRHVGFRSECRYDLRINVVTSLDRDQDRKQNELNFPHRLYSSRIVLISVQTR